MNRERAKELLPIIQAFAEGKDVQCKDERGIWHNECADNPNFDGARNSTPTYWRIKPEPEVIYVNCTAGGEVSPYENKDRAVTVAETSERIVNQKYAYIAKKFIEVVE